MRYTKTLKHISTAMLFLGFTSWLNGSKLDLNFDNTPAAPFKEASIECSVDAQGLAYRYLVAQQYIVGKE